MPEIIKIILIIILVIVLGTIAYSFVSYLRERKTGSGDKFRLFKQIEDFCYRTVSGYKNCDERTVNVIEMQDKDEADYARLIRDLQHGGNSSFITNEDVKNTIINNPEKVVYMKGFFNIKKDYKNDQAKGTFVKQDDIAEIFEESYTPPEDKRKDNGYLWSKKYGKENLNTTAQKLKEQGKEYIVLEASGKEGLVNLYKKYGFNILINRNYNTNIFGNEFLPTQNPIMFGKIDDVIINTRI